MHVYRIYNEDMEYNLHTFNDFTTLADYIFIHSLFVASLSHLAAKYTDRRHTCS